MTNDSHRNFRRSVTYEEDGPVRPPEKLVVESGDGSYRIGFREGARVELSSRAASTRQTLFMNVLLASMALEGQPVRCSRFLPAVSLRIEARHAACGGMEIERFLACVWERVQPFFDKWLADLRNTSSMEAELAGVVVQFARDGFCELRPGVMQIDIVHDQGPAD